MASKRTRMTGQSSTPSSPNPVTQSTTALSNQAVSANAPWGATLGSPVNPISLNPSSISVGAPPPGSSYYWGGSAYIDPAQYHYVTQDEWRRIEAELTRKEALIAALGEALRLAAGALKNMEAVMLAHNCHPTQVEHSLDRAPLPDPFTLSDAYALFHAHLQLTAATRFADDERVNEAANMVMRMKEVVDATVECSAFEVFSAWLGLAGEAGKEREEIARIQESVKRYRESETGASTHK